MDHAHLEAYCLSKPGAWLDQPWEGDHVVKVGPAERGKIFAFLGHATVGLKCGATRAAADEWVHQYPQDASVMAYIGRSGWNTLGLAGTIPEEELLEAIDESYRHCRQAAQIATPAGLGRLIEPSQVHLMHGSLTDCAHRRHGLL